MGSSFGQAIDYLLTVCRAGFTGTDPYGAALAIPSLLTIEPTADVADNLPDTQSGVWVVIGRTGPTDDSGTNATAAYEVLGRQRITESYEIGVEFVVYGDGPDQKPVRDRVIALFDGFVKLVWADPTLGGVLQQGRVGLVSRYTYSQPQAGADQNAGALMVASIAATLTINNSYIP